MKALSLNGGGMLGYIQLRVLELLEEETGQKVQDMFDIFSGVSVGSIICGALCQGMTPQEIKNIFVDMYKNIFGKKRGFIMSLFKPWYDIQNLEKSIHNTIKDITIGELDKPFMTYALRVTPNDKGRIGAKFWKTWKESSLNAPVYKVMCASCAAAQYFKPYEFDNHIYIDGGFVTNNPSMCLLVDMVRHFKVHVQDAQILSIYTEIPWGYKKEDAQKIYGLVNVAEKATGLFIRGAEDIMDVMANTFNNP
jgi:patatin-like phospholipase/acyl hydrolase